MKPVLAGATCFRPEANSPGSSRFHGQQNVLILIALRPHVATSPVQGITDFVRQGRTRWIACPVPRSSCRGGRVGSERSLGSKTSTGWILRYPDGARSEGRPESRNTGQLDELHGGTLQVHPGVLSKDPGVLSKDPGVLLKGPGVLLKPGALLKDPGVLLKDPGFLLKHPRTTGSFKRTPGSFKRTPGSF